MDIARDVRVVKFLPAYFCTISHLLSLLSQDEPSFSDIEKAVSTDQSLTSRLLATVNSPVYGAVRQIGTINEAVVRIGLVGLRNMALAVSISDITGGMKKEEWKHSISVAYMADILARRVSSTPDVLRFAFVSGLMHDIGKLFLTRRYMLEYQSVAIKVRNGFPLVEAEQKIFGYDHAAVGGMLLTAWNVPTPIVDAIRLHHNPGANRLAGVVYFSDQIITVKEHPGTVMKGEIQGLDPTAIDWLYADAHAKAHEMETRIH